MTNITKIIEHARELSEQMSWQDLGNDNGRIIINTDAKDHEELVNLTFEVSEATTLSMDSVYAFTKEVLEAIGESEDEEISLDEAGDNLESDIYTNQLTEWLNESSKHVAYLTEVLEEYSIKDGFQLLSLAQYNAKQEVYNTVREILSKSY